MGRKLRHLREQLPRPGPAVRVNADAGFRRRDDRARALIAKKVASGLDRVVLYAFSGHHKLVPGEQAHVVVRFAIDDQVSAGL